MDNLVELIQSMSKMEKRHFVSEQKKNKSESHVYKLYQEVYKAEDYDENNLKEVFKKESFVNILPTIKNQLYKALLNSLREYHRKSNVDIIIRNELTEIEILIKKKLYAQALKKINALKKPIIKHERFTYHMELILMEAELKFFTLKNQEFYSEITRSIIAARSVGRNYYSYAYQKLMLLRTQSMLFAGKDFGDINYNPLREKNMDSVLSAYYFNLHHSLLYLVQTKDFAAALPYSEILIQMMEDNPHEFEDNPEQKVDVWYACGMAFLYSNEQEKLEKIIKDLTEISMPIKRFELRREERLIDILILQILVNNKNLDQLDALQEKVEKNHKQYSNYYAQKFWDSLASIHLRNNDYRKALKCNYNNIIFKKSVRAEHYYHRAILREIYLYYIQEKYNVFESRYRSVFRSSLDLSDQEKTLLKNLKNDKKVAAFKAYLLRKKKS